MTIRTFEAPRTERVIEGSGSIAQIAIELDSRGLSRALILTGQTIARSEEYQYIVDTLGARVAAQYNEIKAHNPSSGLVALTQIARQSNADVIIAIGGGSAVDAAKLTSLGVLENIADGTGFLRYTLSHGLRALSGSNLIPVIAIPTTLSAAEWNGVAAFVDEASQTKELARYLSLTPNTVFLDPALCKLTPRDLWRTSGVRAIDHAIETIYATNAHPYTTALATGALSILATDLVHSTENPGDLGAALRCQQAAWMSLTGVHNVPVGLSHSIGHQLGAIGVPHGATSCIILPHVLRFYADSTQDRQSLIARVFADARGSKEQLAAADELEIVMNRLRVSRRIGEFGIGADQLDHVASATMREAKGVVDQAPRSVSYGDILSILKAAY